MEKEQPKPCPVCKADPKVCQDTMIPARYFVGCSNELDCPKWPVTTSRATEAEAITAWNKGETL